jgi:outer membrane protein TolC
MHHIVRRALVGLAVATSLLPAMAVPAAAQPAVAPAVRRLSVEDAVRLALEQNLGIQVERFNPQIQDASVSGARGGWAPTLTSTVQDNRSNTPATSLFAGGANNIISTALSAEIGLHQTLPTGAKYAIAWDTARDTSTNIFNSYNPQTSSSVSLSVTQPLLRNFKTDDIRRQLDSSKTDRDAAGMNLDSAIAQTTRQVKNAYWDLTYQIENLRAQQQSLDLARQLLFDNERRVAAGTMASLDIVTAQSEVARNEEGVIVADSAAKQAEDRLRVLVFDPAMPDFWTVSIEPADPGAFQAHTVDVDAAVRHALDERSDLKLAKNALARDDISIKYFHNQTLPQLDAQAAYTTAAVGGSVLSPITTFPVGPIERSIVSQQGFGSVIGNVITSSFPTWTVGVTVGVPIGTSAADADLARAKLQSLQGQKQLKNLELQVVTEVREQARQVQTNQKRVDSARAARELAERRLDAEQKKFAAGVDTSFFVFQAQRDLSQARTDEARAAADYNESLVDFDAVQVAPLGAAR